MQPLRVQAQLWGPVTFRDYIHLDSLLAYAVCLRDEIPMATREDEIIDVEIPVAREPGGRFHLASASVFEWELRERAYLIRRFPVEQAWHRSEMRRVNLSAGAQKNYRIPYERGLLKGDLLTWFAQADRAAVEELLALIHHLGGRRAAGNGRVRSWSIEEVKPWDGFPVVLDGRPLRNLPEDWPGVDADTDRRYGNVTYPYWRRSTEALVVCPNRC